MGYSQFVLRSPYIWIWLSALGTALALSSAVRYLRVRRSGTPHHAGNKTLRDRYIIRCLLSMSVMVGCVTAAVIFPDPRRILDMELLYFFIIIAGLTTISMLFPRAIGLPLAIIGMPPLIFTAIAGAALLPVRSSESLTEIVGRIDIVSATDGQVILELQHGEGVQPILIELQGEYLVVEGSLVRYSGAFFFMGAEAGFRLEGITTMSGDGRTEIDRYNYDARPEGSLVSGLQRLLIAIAGPLPGVAYEALQSMPVRPAIIDSFEIAIDGDLTLGVPTLSLSSHVGNDQ